MSIAGRIAKLTLNRYQRALIDRMAAHGIHYPVWTLKVRDQVARDTHGVVGLPLACALLEQESGGGRNVWGHDPAPNGGTSTWGGQSVSKGGYLAYRARRGSHGQGGMQGVGPCQLTWYAFQDRADQQGGCWEPRANMYVGLSDLASQIVGHGHREGIRAYNGSGAAAERYADSVLALERKWTVLLNIPASKPKPKPKPKPAPVRHPGWIYGGTKGEAVKRLQVDLNTVRGPGERKLTVDGDYGPASQARAVEFKRHHHLTADAIVGTGTFAALAKSVAAHRKPTPAKPAKPKPAPRPPAHRPAGAPPDLPEKWYGHWSQPWHGIHAYPSNYLRWLVKKGHLSPHFTLREAACHDGTPVPARLIGGNHGAQAHAFQLERLRHAIGDVPIPNTSWYRTPAWNAHVGGASESQHIRADATDHGWDWVDRVGRKKVQAAVERIFANDGIGTEGAGHALHVDSRGTRAQWVTW